MAKKGTTKVMADNSKKWHEANQKVLDALDIASVYAELGVRVAKGNQPNAKGWLSCHAHGREDKNASAAINVGDGETRGRYKDFGGGGESLSLWDFAAKVKGWEWTKARDYYAQQAGVKLPSDLNRGSIDQLHTAKLQPWTASKYASEKPPITAQGIFECGGLSGVYPKSASPQSTNGVIAFPAWGSGGLDLDPVGYHIVESAGKMVRRYKGPDNEVDLKKSLQLGSYGLLNRAAWLGLDKASVVWLLEGASDLVSWQSCIPEERKNQHVAFALGGCSYSLKKEHLAPFTGRHVIVVFDNDTESDENAGQLAAAQRVAELAPVANSVRNVELPCNDVREFLQSNSWDDLRVLATTVKAVDKDVAKASALTADELLLKKLGVIVIGQVVGTRSAVIFSRKLMKQTTIPEVSRFTYEDALMAIGGEIMREHVTNSPNPDESVGKTTLRVLKEAIAAVAGRPENTLSGKQEIGAGVWEVDGKVALVNERSVGIWDGRKLTKELTPAVGKQRVLFSEEEWYDHEKLAGYLTLASNPKWRIETLDKVAGIFSRWDNFADQSAPEIVAGLVCATWVQTCWHWRPLVSIIGASKAGKTKLIAECIAEMFGANITESISKPSEPGIRQVIGQTGKVLIIDEIEEGPHRRHVLELLRNSSRGAQVVRGTSNQKGVKFGLRHIVWLGSIELGLRHEADRNRFVQLELSKRAKRAASTLVIPMRSELRDLGQRLLAIAVYCMKDAVAQAEALGKNSYDVDQRIAECYAVAASMWGIARDLPEEIIEGTLRRWISERDFSTQEGDEEEDLLQTILTQHVQQHGERWTVAQLISGEGQQETNGKAVDRSKLLQSVGIGIFHDGLFVASKAVEHHLLRNTDQAGISVSQILGRMPGAKKMRRRLSQQMRGVLLPFDSIDLHVPHTYLEWNGG